MTDTQARSLVCGLGLVIAALIAALAFGRAAVDVVLVLGFLWFLWDRITAHDRIDEALERSDEAHGRIEAVENHLSGLEPASQGKHGSRREAA